MSRSKEVLEPLEALPAIITFSVNVNGKIMLYTIFE